MPHRILLIALFWAFREYSISETLTSPKNPLLKSVRRAVSRGETTEDGFCIAEGPHLLEEAVRSGAEIGAVIVTERALTRVEQWPDLRVIAIPESLLEEISTTETSQGIVALVRIRDWTIADIAGGLVVVLDGIQEPGNAGAIARVAEAFGASGMICLKGTVNPYNPKSLRASAGSSFRLPCVRGVAADALDGMQLFAAVQERGVVIHEADLGQPCAIVIGSEGRGVQPELLSRSTRITIPTHGVESLNAAVAAGVILYEAQRQRAQR